MIDSLILQVDDYLKKNMKFINKSFGSEVKQYIIKLMPRLNNYDMNILYILTLYMIEDISVKYNFPRDIGYKQWLKNDGRDISSLCLTLIPYIGDNNYDIITNLTDIIYASNEKTIDKEITSLERSNAIKRYFPFSNFSLGLLNETTNLLDLYATGQHTIYHTIEMNFISMLETIKITNGKLYVNWINVIPLVNYKDTQFYKISMNEIRTIQNDIRRGNIDINNYNSNGLWLGDYYNVYANAYFYNFRQIKWLIFCKRINSKYYYMLQYLNKMIDLNIIIKTNDYNEMTDASKKWFRECIDRWIFNIKNNQPIYKDLEWELDILKTLFSFMRFNYSKLLIVSDILKSFKVDVNSSKRDLDPSEDEKEMGKITNEQVLYVLEKIDIVHIWTYLKEIINILITTPYAKYLIKNNNIDMDFFNVHDGINLKNIYNIAKLLCHDNINNIFTFIGTNFKALSRNYIERFLVAFNTDSTIWIRIRQNLIRQEGSDININNIMARISDAWNIIKYDLVWEYLNENGLLSKFNINLEVTDESYLVTSDTNEEKKLIKGRLKKFFKNNMNMFDCNYYLTNKPYKELKKYGRFTYDEILTEAMVHYTFYANDWISQLNFFNHYINHSVMYVTGSTGTGKSTQVPKLTMYCLKMYDYKNNGRIICTQPRIPPTQDNAKRISKELGVDIVYNDNMNVEYKTDQYFVQYKHQKDNHIKNNCNHLTLRMVTDGTLLEELITNPFMKERAKATTNDLNYILGIRNTYDVIMVDEAHEHNTNMDVILTLMRQTCMYNNSIRLMIISATMDDDEPIYRSYYKLINDNIVHPIKQPLLLNPITKTEDYFIDCIYLDRRIHISIPKKSYSYKITEYYDENIEKQFTTDMRKNLNLAQTKSYNIIKMICNTSVFGDILLFSIGKEEIKSAVRELNRIIPFNVIALPFYSEMHTKYRDIISNIHITVGMIRNKKDNIAEEWSDTYYDIKAVPEGTYKRAIIIATNVAEASITIESLRYVVDTGFANVSRYDNINDTMSINVEHISESSRIQRKGRIGRVAEGTVYYLYGKNKRLHIKPKYGITLTDFHSTFIKLASKYMYDNKMIFMEPELTPYLYNNFHTNAIDNFGNKESNIYIYNIFQTLLEQFMPFLAPIEPSFFYPFNELQNNILPLYFNRLVDGYSFITLIDSFGLFYIVHPFENYITRNVLGNIIMANNIVSNKLKDDNFNTMLRITKNKLLYIPVDLNLEGNLYEEHYLKTEYFDKINEILRIVQMGDFIEKDAMILLLASAFNITLESCEVLSMIKSCNALPSNIASSDNFNNMYEIFKSDSDITSIYNIILMLRKKLPNLYIYTVHDKPNIMMMFKGFYDDIVIKFKNKRLNEIKDSLDIMNHLYNNGMLDSTKGFLSWIKYSNKFRELLMDDINNNINIINKICNDYYLNYKVIMDYYEYLINIIIKILSAELEYDEEYGEISVFKWAKKLHSSMIRLVKQNTIEEKLNICFFMAQPLYLCASFNNMYINMSANECNIKQLFIPPRTRYNNTLCNMIGGMIGYYSYSNGNISIIYNIDMKIIPVYYPIYYNNTNIKNIYYSDNNIKQFNSSDWDRFIMTVSNSSFTYNLNTFPLNNIEFPTIQQYIKTLIKIDK